MDAESKVVLPGEMTWHSISGLTIFSTGRRHDVYRQMAKVDIKSKGNDQIMRALE